jgi:asparagine synthase (glutamine-hydrolysing)
LLAPDLALRMDGLTSWDAIQPIRKRFEENCPDRHPLNWMSYLDLNLRLPELLLMRVDKMSMATSLECRVPFLDHEFVQLAMSIPPAVKTRDGNLKGILKKAVRGIIPDDIIDRRKQGFGVPVYDWLFGELGSRIRDEVLWFSDRSGVFEPSAVRQYFDGPPSAHAWTLYNVALWWREYFE